jgi:hypothetical protein
MSFRIAKDKLPCKFGSHFTDSVPMPFGSGNCSMPGFECEYQGDIQIPDDMVCEENSKCPAYQPVETTICPKHDEEYYDMCGACEEETFGELGI